MASGLYGITFLNALKNDLALDLDDTTADRFKVMLVTSSYTPNFGTHDGRVAVWIYLQAHARLPLTLRFELFCDSFRPPLA